MQRRRFLSAWFRIRSRGMQPRRETASDPLLVAVCALGIAQITAWGTSYYALGVLAGPIVAQTGWSRTLVYFGFTVALLAMGAASPYLSIAFPNEPPQFAEYYELEELSAEELARWHGAGPGNANRNTVQIPIA